jgi:hypothetical protein
MRTFNAAAQALLDRIEAGEQGCMTQLVLIAASVPLRFTTAGITVRWAGEDWYGNSVAVEPVADAVGELPSIVLRLPAITEDQISLVLTTRVEGLSVTIYDALVDPDTGVVEDAEPAWAGSLNVPSIEDGPTAVISVTCEHRGMSALRAKPSRYTDDEQRRLHPGDTSLDVDPATDAGPIVWPAASYFRQ